MADSESEAGPDDYWSPWAMRRREASDDEDTSGEHKAVRTNRRAFTGFDDDDSEGAGRAPEDDDVSFFDELDALDREEQVLFQEKEGNEEEDKIKNEEVEAVAVAKQRRQEEQKNEEREVLRVPMGAFYMHDDRFESGRTEPRLTFGRKNLRQFKDEKKWQHDKFEELENQRLNARPKVQKISVPFNQGYYIKKGRDKDVKANLFKPNASYDSEIAPSRNVRGRGPVRYKPLNSNNDIVPPIGNKGLRKFPGVNCKPFDHSSGVYPPTRNKEKLRGVNSNSYSAKVDCNSHAKERQRYCASSSNPNISITNKRDVQSGKVEGYFQNTPLLGDNTSMADPSAYLQGKTIADSSGRGRLYANRSIDRVSGHNFSTPYLQSSLPTSTMESSRLMGQARDFPFSVLNAHQSPAVYNVGQVSPTKNNHALQQGPARYTQQLSTHSGINSEASSLSGTDLRIMESFARPSESEITWAGMESRINQGTGRSYQLGESHDPQIFSTTRPLLPAVQFRDQYVNDGRHAVDRAFDKSVVQQQVGFGNSGMTWTPGLPENVGFLHSHCATPTGNHQVFSLGQESFTGIASTEADANKAFTLDGTEDVENGSRNQRSKFQRYSNMNFDH